MQQQENTDPNLHLVGTYNMSFYSDKDFDPTNTNPAAQHILATVASERAFHMSNTTGNWRQYWLNALNIVQQFWQQPNASVLGLQEMTFTPPGSPSGTAAVQDMLSRLNPALRMVVGEVKETGQGKNANVSICITWNSAKLGDVLNPSSSAYYVETKPMQQQGQSSQTNPFLIDLDYSVPQGSNSQNGRPMLILLTTQGYLLVCLHAPNHEFLSERNLDELRAAIKTNIATFMQLNNVQQVDPTKIFIMGDFNDRYDALQSINSMSDVMLRYQGKAPLSCCHNWDSSCSLRRFEAKEQLPNRQGRSDIGTCNITKPDGTKYALVGNNPRDRMGSEGDIRNYKYYGDKVFGYSPVGPLSLFPPGRTGPSTESDHEMVVGLFGQRRTSQLVNKFNMMQRPGPPPFTGGRYRTRTSRRRNTKRRNTKRRNTKRRNTKRRNTKRRNTKRRNTKRRNIERRNNL